MDDTDRDLLTVPDYGDEIPEIDDAEPDDAESTHDADQDVEEGDA